MPNEADHWLQSLNSIPLEQCCNTAYAIMRKKSVGTTVYHARCFWHTV